MDIKCCVDGTPPSSPAPKLGSSQTQETPNHGDEVNCQDWLSVRCSWAIAEVVCCYYPYFNRLKHALICIDGLLAMRECGGFCRKGQNGPQSSKYFQAFSGSSYSDICPEKLKL